MAVREYPNIDPPVVSVRTVYKGATAQVMESAVTQPLEDSLSGIEGIKTIKSQSREEVSQITVTFLTSRDIDARSQRRPRPRVAHPQTVAGGHRRAGRVQDRSRRAGDHLDRGIERPTSRRWRSPTSPTAT